jgi:hypothetical protein
MDNSRESNKAAEGTADRLRLTLRADWIPLFFPFLQKGFMLEVKVGCSVRSFLLDQLGLSAEYIEGRIQTIFVDGKPVDDLDRVAIRDGSTLALSSALPGLLGATLRRGGYYAAMRSQITHREDPVSRQVTDGHIIMKLFNLTLSELGPPFLERGVWVKVEDLSDLFKKLPTEFPQGCRDASLNGDRIAPEGIRAWPWKGGWIFLQAQGC